MRIMHIMMTGNFTEGRGYQENLLTEYQQKHGHEVILVVPPRKRGEDGSIIITDECTEYMTNGVLLIRVDFGKQVTRFLGYYSCVPKLLDKYAPDLVFVHGLCTLIPGQAIAYKKKHPSTKIVADSHQDEGNTYTTGIIHGTRLKIYRILWKHWIKNICKVYGTTSWRTDFAHRYYGIPENKLDTLIMGVNTDAMPENADKVREEVRKELNIPPEAFVFVFGGKMRKYRNIVEALEAFSEMKNDNTYFVVFGTIFEDVKNDVERLISENDHIKYLGFIDGSITCRYLMAADFGMYPGLHSVLWEESIGCGLPCVFQKYAEKDHTDVCGNCIRLENPDKNKIRQVMEKVVNDKAYYDELKQNAKKAAHAFSYHTIAEKSVECLEEQG